MPLLEYSADIVRNNPTCKEVHNCNVCSYFTTSIFLIRNHVRRHLSPDKTFNCQENTPEIYHCKDCNFKTDLTILFKKHIQEIHLTRSENGDESQSVEYTLQRFICGNCMFETYSFLHWLKHFRICPSTEETQHEEADGQKIPSGRSHKIKNKKDLSTRVIRTHDKASKMPMLEYSADIVRNNPTCKEVHTCNVCSYFTTSIFLIRNHVRRHLLPSDKTFNCQENTPEIYHCKDCNFKTDLTILFKKHIQEIHLTRSENGDESQSVEYTLQRFICGNCMFETYSFLHWLKHFRICSSIEETQHEEADGQKILSGRSHKIKNKKKRVIRTHGENSFECYHCGFKTHVKNSLKKHIFNMHTPLKNYLHCDKCSFKTLSASGLRKHKQNHRLRSKEVKWYQCMNCLYKTKRKADLSQHILRIHKAHNEINWFRCDHCDYKAKMKYDLKSHQYFKHEKDENIRWRKCNICSYKTKDARPLKRHIYLKHTKLKDADLFHCDKCSFQTKHKTVLRGHNMRLHLAPEELQWHQCDKCPYKTRIKNNLRYHKDNTHCGKDKTQLACSQCPFQANGKWLLKNHVKYTHEIDQNTKLFECYHCSYKSKVKSVLKNHIFRIHRRD